MHNPVWKRLGAALAAAVAIAASSLAGVAPTPAPAAFAAALPPAGVFNVHCSLSHSKQVDPIVAPGPEGTMSAHLHDFFGNTTTDSFSTYDTMVGQPSTCPLPGDSAAYWVPAIYQNGVKLQPKLLNVYYRRSTNNPLATAFPPDFRMISHDSAWACGAGSPETPAPRDCGAKLVTIRILFPQCWDGVNTDSADHISHITTKTVKGCANSGGVWMPHVLMAIQYPTHTAAGITLAPGSPDVHADFWNTWDQPTLEGLVDMCLNMGMNCKNLH